MFPSPPAPPKTFKHKTKKKVVDFHGLPIDRSFIACLVARKGSGKSTTLCKLLTTPGGLYQQFDKIVFFSPTFRLQYPTLWSKLAPDGITVYEHIKEDILEDILVQQSVVGSQKMLIIFDDCVDSLKKFPQLEAKLVCNSRHMNVSLISLNQKLTQISTTMRSNTDLFLIWAAISEREIRALWSEVSVMPLADFRAVFHQITCESYAFLVCSMVKGKMRFYNSFKTEISINTSQC